MITKEKLRNVLEDVQHKNLLSDQDLIDRLVKFLVIYEGEEKLCEYLFQCGLMTQEQINHVRDDSLR